MDQAINDLAMAPAAARRRRATLRVAIVGAGFGGIGLAVLLKKAGFTAITVFERGSAVGGTWRDNSYLGAACDVQSHLYSFSFAPRAEWSQRYSGQAEILDYLQGVGHCRMLDIVPVFVQWLFRAAGGVFREAGDYSVGRAGNRSEGNVPWTRR